MRLEHAAPLSGCQGTAAVAARPLLADHAAGTGGLSLLLQLGPLHVAVLPDLHAPHRSPGLR